MSQKIKFVLVSIIFFSYYSCGRKINYSENKVQEVKWKISERYLFDTLCLNKDGNTCENLFDCHYKRFISANYVDFNEKIDSVNIIGDLLYCSVQLLKNKNIRQKEANVLLYHFYNNFNKYTINYGFKSPLYSPIDTLNNKFVNILSQWNTVEAFDICMQYSSKNYHDSMGHGDCENLSVEFIIKIVIPKIKTIDGTNFWTYFDKHNHGDHGPADCYDSMYEALYPMLKKAWEEGKIVLKTNE
ncbi:MAG: hypothetical protein H6567_05355 [Lewinellaceae bacterium]|nr:hypothetical protein [Lewinellaceae bacterium]